MRVRGSQATRNACSDTVSNGIALGGRNKLYFVLIKVYYDELHRYWLK